MKSRTLPRFWKQFDALPAAVQRRAHRAYHLWRSNPLARSLYFKSVSDSELIYSVRIGMGYRALGLVEGDTIYWYFIGDHDAYERELKRL
jgi:hypothetical protein